jgi:hypothetical protein
MLNIFKGRILRYILEAGEENGTWWKMYNLEL